MMQKMKSVFVALLISMAYGCAGPSAILDAQGNNLIQADGVVTLVNLHPDMVNPPRFSAVNWIRPSLLPMCTEVRILEVGRKVAKIQDKNTGVVYNYFYHKAAAEPFAEHLKRYFGTRCDSDKVAKLSKLDKEGIKLGKAKKGMSKQGVVYALGYPARHVTPTTELNEWKYWKGRYDTMLVRFENDKVVQIID